KDGFVQLAHGCTDSVRVVVSFDNVGSCSHRTVLHVFCRVSTTGRNGLMGIANDNRRFPPRARGKGRQQGPAGPARAESGRPWTAGPRQAGPAAGLRSAAATAGG